MNVSASLVCPNSANVSWVGSPSATAYNATIAVEAPGGGITIVILHCYTTSTSCQIPNIPCGQNYTITVTPYADTCAGIPSIPHHSIAGTQREQDLESKSYVLI